MTVDTISAGMIQQAKEDRREEYFWWERQALHWTLVRADNQWVYPVTQDKSSKIERNPAMQLLPANHLQA